MTCPCRLAGRGLAALTPFAPAAVRRVLLVIAHQAENVLGVHVVEAGTFLGVVRNTLARLGDAQLPTLALAGATAAIMFLLRRFAPRLPRVALTLVASVGLGYAAQHFGHAVEMLPAITATSWQAPADLNCEQLWEALSDVVTNAPERNDSRLFVADSLVSCSQHICPFGGSLTGQ